MPELFFRNGQDIGDVRTYAHVILSPMGEEKSVLLVSVSPFC